MSLWSPPALAGALSVALLSALPAAASPSLEEQVRAIVEREGGLDLRVRRLDLRADSAVIGVEVPEAVSLDDPPAAVENTFEEIAGAIAAERPEVASLHFLVAHPGGRLRSPGAAEAARERPKARPELEPPPERQHRSVTRAAARFPFGLALAGKTVALSPGHGYIYYDNLGRYATQRGNVRWTGCGDCRGIVEDFETHEITIDHLIPLLEGAGARVILVRDRARTSSVAIADDADAAAYREVAGSFVAGTGAGAWGTGYRAATDPGARAEWTLAAPASGPQHLSIWFVSSSNRAPDARLFVEALGRRHEFVFDARTHGRRWAPIGIFDLDVQDVIRVAVETDAAATGALVADAVRLGAGRHTSGHTWWQMGAQPFATAQRAPSQVLAYGDVTIRPRYAEWYGADVYFSLHSNASGQPDSTAVGTSSYRYNCGRYPDHSADPPASSCDDPTGSDRLQELIHTRVIQSLQGSWDPNWRDRGPKVANFGELRELDGIPGMLLESGFHDNVRLAEGSNLRMTDNQSIHDPRWRRALARGIYAGLSEFLSAGAPLVLPPPSALAARRASSSSIELRFTPVAGARGYRVYTAQSSRVFDEGQIVNGPPAVIGGLAADEPAFFRIATLNEGGEGPQSAVTGAKPGRRKSQILILDGFEREDAWVQEIDNRHDEILVHGRALAASPLSFDGADEAALVAGLVSLADYEGLVLAFGRESTEHEVLTPALRSEILSFVSTRGGAVMASGSEIGWALDERGNMESKNFLGSVFGADYLADDSGERSARAVAGGLLGALSGATIALEDGSGIGPVLRSPDVFAAVAGSGARVELTYGGGDAAAALSAGKSFVLGFPLETVRDPGQRAAILRAWAEPAIIPGPIEPEPDGGIPPDSGALDSGAADAGDPLDAGATDARAPAAPDAEVRPQLILTVVDPDARAVEEDGCGCRSDGSGGASRGAHLLLLLLVLAALRRSR